MSDLYTESFLEFYAAYPRHVGKREGAKAWAKLTEDQHKAALADVQKRTRMSWWSSEPKKIAHCATYLNQHRFEDEWLDDFKIRHEASPQAPSRTTYEEPEVQLGFFQRAANRLAFVWLTCAGGVECVEALTEIKRTTLREVRGVVHDEPAVLAELLLDRLDKAYGRGLKDQVMRHVDVMSESL